jgi:archaellum biogenesis protein FlaJ (TadC family)
MERREITWLKLSNEDLVNTFMLYVAMLGLSNVSVKQFLKTVSISENLPVYMTKQFKKACALMERWSYGLSEALEYLSKHLREARLKNFFVRLTHSLKAGVTFEDLARIEYNKYLAEKANDFEKGLEKLRKLVEAYTTLISTVALLSVSFLLITTVFGDGSEQFLTISLASIGATLSSTSLLFATNTLRRKVLNNYGGVPKKIITLNMATAPLIVISATVLLVGVLLVNSVWSASTTLAVAGLPLAVHGFLGRRFKKRVEASEASLPLLLKSMGDYMAVTGSLNKTSHLLTLSDFGQLNRLVHRLEARVKAGIGMLISLKIFGLESLSSIGSKVFSMLGEALEAGVKPTVATGILSEYVTSVIMNDRRRSQITASLKTLSLPLHATLAAIFALLTTLLTILSQISALLSPQMMFIRPVNPYTAVNFFYTVMVLTAAITAVNIYLSDGDTIYTLTQYLGTILVISSATYLAMSIASGSLLTSFAKLTKGVSGLVPGGG